jgi:adenylate kinase
MEKGELVPDSVILDLIKDRIDNSPNQDGYVLDGFPRTIPQAEMLDRMLSGTGRLVDLAVKMTLSDETAIGRLQGRLTCSKCGANCNTFFSPPSKPDKCAVCGGQLEKRGDDQPEVLQRRLHLYRNQSQPVEEYYRRLNRLVDLDASQDAESVSFNLGRLIRDKKG